MTSAPAPGPDGAWRRPSRRLLHAQRALGCGTVGLLGLLFAGAVVPVFGRAVALVPLAVTALLAGAIWYGLGRRWASWGYLERDDDLLVRRGVLYHRLSAVPYGRMQFVDVTAGPLDRWLGLASVHLHTAAAATDAVVPGLTASEAARLRDRLAALGEARAAGL